MTMIVRIVSSHVVSRFAGLLTQLIGGALLLGITSLTVAHAEQIILTTGTSWTVPSDWNSNGNSIEAIGGGGGGGGAAGGNQGANGGGGGEYRKVVNVPLSPGTTIPVVIGTGGAGGTTAPGAGAAGSATIFNGSMLIANPGQGGAPSGLATASGAAGGSGGVGSAAHANGGAGGGRSTLTAGAGQGGGGAGGRTGPGAAGGSSSGTGAGAAGGGAANGGAPGANVPSSNTGASGGNNAAGTGGGAGGSVGVVSSTGSNGGGAAGTNGGGGGGGGGLPNSVTGDGGAGGAGSEWGSVGAGGGGGGGAAAYTTVSGAGGHGGTYGGGGGGAGSSTFAGNVGGAGGQGVIVITYTPLPHPVASSGSTTRSSSFAYDSSSGLLTQEVVEPNTTALRLQTDYAFDTFGNKVGVTVSGADITSHSSSTSYDARGQFVVTNTNALGQSESFQYDPRFGAPTSHTGPNGLTTTWSYDVFGRKILEVRSDGTQTKWAYQFCSGVNGGSATCPAGASYRTQETPLASDGATQNGPISLIYFDLLDREVGRDTQGFDGSTVRATRQYDALGRVSQTSRPYFAVSGTPQWTVNSYDAISRVVSSTQPDGSVSKTAYHGLTTVETNALNQVRTVTKNSQGKVVAITDALGKTMTFAYDPVGNLIQTNDSDGNVVTATYDTRGRKTASADPDLGNWSYTYDTLGELLTQTDAKGQVVSLSYDKLGRMVQRVEPDMTSVWAFDTAPNGIGKLASASITMGSGNGFARAMTYDALGRPVQLATTVDGATYTMGAAYDANSRLTQISYPSGFTAKYAYNSLGYANQLLDAATGQVHWTANAMDAEQHILQQTAGNGLVTTRNFDIATGRLNSIVTGSGNAVQNLSYTYDRLGNPLSRSDANSNVTDTFVYDGLNRLTSSTTNLSPTPLVKTYSYSAIGNILSKSDVGTYNYPSPGSPQPHAVTSVSGGAISTTFTYDANGNQTSGLGRSIVYTSYNKPASITQGSRTISFRDDTEHQRFKQVTPEGTTLYIEAFGVLAEVQNPGTTTQKWSEYLAVGNAKVGMRVLQTASETISTRYFMTDHLGSISVITDENGLAVERLSYDAWGKRRNVNGTDDVTGSITSQSTRGFTGEEELSVGGLVHLNGRVYDPLLARFTSADPTVTDPMNMQGWNRYSYVGNDPLAFTDPNGFSWLSSFFHSVANFFTHNPIVRAIVQIALTLVVAALLTPVAVAAGLALSAAQTAAGIAGAFIGSAITTGLSGGNLGQVLRAGALAAATAFAFDVVGGATNAIAADDMNAFSLTDHAAPGFGTPEYAFNVAGHALVGCASSAASGGDCKSGALSGGVTAAAGPLINQQDFTLALTENAIVGGLASVAGGGKFANGAITGAFSYLFNFCGGPNGCLKWGAAIGAGIGAIAAAGCDYGSAGVCILANPAMIGSAAAGGGAFGAAIDRAWDQLDGLLRSVTSSGPQAYQYALIADQSGPYPDVRNGITYLNAGDVWKYGTTVDPADRYSGAALRSLGLTMVIETTGTVSQVLVQEKIQLIGYATRNGSLPPGNKIFK